MYEWVSGPLVWFGFIVLIGGTLYRVVAMGLLARREGIVFPTYDLKFGMRSVMHWVVPFAGRNMRLRPFFTMLSFAFHVSLLLVPLFALGHAVLWKMSWGLNWWSLPESLTDALTLIVIFGGLVFALRRIAAPEVRNVTTWKDYGILLLVVSPFVTGFVAHHHWLPYQATILVHIVCGVLWLIAIPFTRLAHMLWFVFSRAFMGSEFGAVRSARDW